MAAKIQVKAPPNAELYNIWVSYETGALTLAAEYNDYENAGAAGNVSGDSLMGLARYALNEKSSITGRYSEENLNDGRATEKMDNRANLFFLRQSCWSDRIQSHRVYWCS